VPNTKSSVAPHLERRVRSRDNDTAWAAAAGINTADLSKLKVSILRILTDRGPLTDEAIYVEYVKRGYPRRTAQRVRTARHEITTPHEYYGWTQDTSLVRPADGDKARLDSGYHGQKWERIS
jgi:hypothetical protein